MNHMIIKSGTVAHLVIEVNIKCHLQKWASKTGLNSSQRISPECQPRPVQMITNTFINVS